jgi:cytochrome c oxidase subunit 2
VLDDGHTVLADEAYVRESILNPNAKVVKGYKHDIMPVFQGQIGEDGLLQLIAYIKSLSPPTPKPAKAAVPVPGRDSK